jgi:hypothetical protein
MKLLLVVGFGGTLLCLTSCRQGEATQRPHQENIVGNSPSMVPTVVVDQLRGIDEALTTCDSAERLSKNKSVGKSFGGYFGCVGTPSMMAGELESEFQNAFQRNSDCKGITLVLATKTKTYYLHPKIQFDEDLHQLRVRASTPEETQRLSQGNYRVYFAMKVTRDGDIDWSGSKWNVLKTPLPADFSESVYVYGSMNNLEKETTTFCGVIRSEGGSVR